MSLQITPQQTRLDQYAQEMTVIFARALQRRAERLGQNNAKKSDLLVTGGLRGGGAQDVISAIVSPQLEAQKIYIKKMIQVFTDRDTHLAGRKVAFLNTQNNGKELALFVTGGVVGGATTGGVVGTIVGGVCGGPPGMVIGAIIGVPVGIFIGGLAGGGAAYLALRHRYEKFCKTEAGKEFAGNLLIYLQKAENELLDNFTCAITLMPVLDGVRTPDGQIYERTAIEGWIEKKGTNPKIPEQKLTKAMLIPDNDASYNSAKEFVKFLKEKRAITQENADHLLPGYDGLIRDIRDWGISIGNQKLAVLQKELGADKITYEAFQQGNTELQRYYNI